MFAINNLHLQIITSYWSKFFHQQRFEHIVISISKCSQSESIIISDDGNNHFKTREACNDNLTVHLSKCKEMQRNVWYDFILWSVKYFESITVRILLSCGLEMYVCYCSIRRAVFTQGRRATILAASLVPISSNASRTVFRRRVLLLQMSWQVFEDSKRCAVIFHDYWRTWFKSLKNSCFCEFLVNELWSRFFQNFKDNLLYIWRVQTTLIN